MHPRSQVCPQLFPHAGHPSHSHTVSVPPWPFPRPTSATLLLHCCCCCQVASVVSDSVRPHRWQPTRLPSPWDSPGKNTGVGCHFLLQCRTVKRESEVTQSCLTLSDSMDCSLPGSSIHGIFQARVPSGLLLPSPRYGL